MNSIISTLFSWTFIGGFLVGLVVQRGYCHFRVHLEDRTHPLPRGQKRHVSGLNRVWVAGAITVTIIGTVMYSTENTHDLTVANAQRTEQLASDTKACQAELIRTLKERAEITRQDNILSMIQRRALADWFGVLLNPPPEVLAMNKDSDEYRDWSYGITQFYYGKIRQAQDSQDNLDRKRQANPYPEPDCAPGGR